MEIIERVDIIEGFSSGMKNEVLDYQAWELANQSGLPPSGGSDGRVVSEI
jgi:hypothetical protein